MIVGKHILLDLFEVSEKTFEKIYKANFENFNDFICKIIKTNGATLLNSNVNHFNERGAFTALYLLAESHISIHTWPEHNYIAIDIFTCGDSNTQEIANEIKKYFESKKITEKLFFRGNNNHDFNNTRDKIILENYEFNKDLFYS